MPQKLTILLLLISTLGFSQNQEAELGPIKTDTAKITKNLKMILLPIAFYTPETTFALGAGTQMFFKTKGSTDVTRQSNVFGAIIYTLKKQFIVQVKPKIYFGDESFFLDGEFKYQVFPNSFWGIGGDTPDSAREEYNQTETLVKAALLKRLPNHVNFGFQFTYANYIMTEVEPGKQLESGNITGSDGAKLLGLGVVFNLDTRDNIFSPLGGGFYQFNASFSSKAMGSTQSFNYYQFDFRKYVNIAGNHVIAAQFYTFLTFGENPFQLKAHYGGADVARGYFKGRYIDQHLYVAQIEYRLPVLKRWELAAFALTGNVGSNNGDLFSDFKSSVGFGPRYFISKDNRSVLRLDFSFNTEGGNGIYFGINEAF